MCDESKLIKNESAPNSAVHKYYVFGYRCKDTRNNIRYLSSNKIVYHAAAVGVVFDPETNT